MKRKRRQKTLKKTKKTKNNQFISIFQYIQYFKGDSVLFCDYPFVFDAKAKTLLLQTDADIQMQVSNLQIIF